MISDIFCKIINKDIPSEIIAEGEGWIAIKDIAPKAPVHVLIIPKKHIGGMEDIEEDDAELIGRMVLGAQGIARKMGVSEKGYRLIINHGVHGGQLVPHLHFHLLGGKVLGAKLVQE